MKAKTKALVLAFCAVLLVATTVFVTVAYLTSQDSVTNTFTVGKVAITLDEAKVKTDGTVDGTDRVKENTYKLVPGHTYTKDPTVHIDDDSEDAYLFVKLVITDNADLKSALAKYNLSDDLWDLLTGSVKNDWNALGNTTANNGTGTYLLTYKATVNGQTDDIKLFDSIKVPAAFTDADLTAISDFKIEITAYAVQADGFKTAADAWAATFGASK